MVSPGFCRLGNVEAWEAYGISSFIALRWNSRDLVLAELFALPATSPADAIPMAASLPSSSQL